MLKHTLLLIVILLYSKANAQTDWVLTKQSDGIKVYTKPTVSGFKAYYGIDTIKATLIQCANLIMDLPTTAKWSQNCVHAEVIKNESPILKYEYFQTDLPFPISDRDVLFKATLTIDTINHVVIKQLKSAPDYIARNADYLRIEDIHGKWQFKAIENDQIEVIYEMYPNPSGKLPSWLVNMMVVQEPFESLEQLKIDIKNEKYNSIEDYNKFMN